MPALFPEHNGAQVADYNTTNGSSSETFHEHLRTLIEDKEKQLVLVGTLGQRFLSQQVELEERMRQLDEIAASDGHQLENQSADLAGQIRAWEDENQQMWAAALTISSQMTAGGGDTNRSMSFSFDHSSQVASSFDEDDFNPPRETGPSAAQSSRRAKNAGINRPNSVEFATEIGNQLTREIRRVQALLSERDKALQDLKEERDDLQRLVESLEAALKERQDAAEKFKDENWNLEYQVQELTSKLAESTADRQRAESEAKRLTKQLTTVRETVDNQKADLERLQMSHDDLKSKHETDVAQMRKTNAGLQREKSDLQTVADTLRAEIAQKARALPNRFGSPVTPSDSHMDQDDVFTGGGSRRKHDVSAFKSPDVDEFDASPDPSPSKPSLGLNTQSNEVDALKQSLAHAHRQMQSLKNSVQREKELKLDARRRLALETGSPGEWEDEEDGLDGSPNLSRSRNGLARSQRRTPRGRGPSQFSVARQLAMAQAERALEEAGSPDRSVSHHNIVADEEHSPFFEPSSRPTSVDGMDPAFANILRSAPSVESVGAEAPSLPPNPRRRGGGAFVAEPRPSSLVNEPPSALASELSALSGDLPDVTDDFLDNTTYGYYSKPATADISIQCDPPEEFVPVSPPATTAVAVQCDLIEAQPMKETGEISVQASAVLPSLASIATQTSPDPIPMQPELRVASVGTDAEIIVERSQVSVSTIPLEVLNCAVQTDVAEMEVQTVSIDTSDRLEIIQPVPSNNQLLPLSSDVAVPRASFYGRPAAASGRPVAMLFDDESEADTETETEGEYVDARETEQTPSSSVQDFHSVESPSEESEADSIHTSVAPFPGRLMGMRSRHDSYATTRAAITPSTKPATKDISMQTDPWTPVVTPPVLPTTIAFQRAGSSQPFQFIPPSPAKSTPSSLAIAANIVKSPMQQSGSFGSRAHASSTASSEAKADNDDTTTTSLLSFASIDKTRPPTMSLPPPPNMPPPTTIPLKKSSVPPPRPTSPPPPELIQRATTPTFGRQSSLHVPGVRAPRTSLGSQPLPDLRQPPSMSSFRSSNNIVPRAITRSGPPPPTFVDPLGDRGQISQMSLVSGYTGPRSRRASIASSRSSERGIDMTPSQPTAVPMASSTDPAVIHAITQTMIGEFLFKYTRRVVGKGHGEKRHKRFFWVHPYTRTLYWSSADPGASHVGESNAKSAYIDGVKQVIDPNPLPPGLHQYSIIVYTPQREMKFTAPTKERHEIWFKALTYLLDKPASSLISTPAGAMSSSPMVTRTRSSTTGMVSEDGVLRGRNAVMASPASVRTALSNESADSWNITPRVRGGMSHLSPPSVGRRAGTPAAEYMRTYTDQAHRPTFPDTYSPTKTTRSLQQRFEDALDNHEDDDYENVDPNMGPGDFQLHSDPGFEGLPNVRACCEGEHDLGDLMGKGHHHHHHHHHHQPNYGSIRPSSRLSNRSRNEHFSPSSRPVSPSAFSGRSRSGSQRSDGASLFNLRFGSKRSTKSSAPPF